MEMHEMSQKSFHLDGSKVGQNSGKKYVRQPLH